MFSAVFLFTICGLPPEQAEADVNIKISRPWTAGKQAIHETKDKKDIKEILTENHISGENTRISDSSKR